jgi:ectoine hydroxylase-related dioxygenase (phytanoyl-CoA dioxygenase family)
MEITGDYPLSPEQIAVFRAKGHILLPGVAAAEEIEFFRPAIIRAAARYSREKRPLTDRDTYGKAFLQIANLWEVDESVRRFVFARKFARVAAGLLGVENVRLYHDQALFKEAGGGYTPWHQDQFYWNLDTSETVTMWMPLVEATAEMGLMKFASRSHLGGLYDQITISDRSAEIYSRIIADHGFEISRPPIMQAGDATFHYGHTIHCAGENSTRTAREVMTVIYFADGAKITEPLNRFQEADHRRWLDALPVGTTASGRLNPVLG